MAPVPAMMPLPRRGATMFVNDRSGAPMIRVASIGAYVHWLPVTKLQFEYFLCDQPGNRFDQKWYDDVLKVHKQNEPSGTGPARVSPAMVRRDNYYRALLTGIRPTEIAPFISWL